MPPSVLHLSTYDVHGGAARAAYALHRAMVDSGVNSTMRVARKSVDDSTVTAGSDLRFRVANRLDRQVWRLQHSPQDTWRSPAVFGSLSADEVNRSAADVVNLHWVTAGFLSIKEIGRITKPLVWSLYDRWPFSGTEHYGDDSPSARWRTGYTRDNRPTGEHGFDIDRQAWENKRRGWRPGPLVAASTATSSAVAASALMSRWPLTLIPHVIDSDVFAPMDRGEARAHLGLRQGPPLVLFLSAGGPADRRKGWDLLVDSLARVREQVPDVEVVAVGPKGSLDDEPAGVPVHWAGSIHGDEALRLHYCATDVTAVPSREDNMPLTAMEAQTCGRPVVAFAIGGLPDIVEHRTSGYLAPAEDSDSLAEGLKMAILDSQGNDTWGRAGRNRALAQWSRQVVVPRYLEVYQQALA